MHLKIKKKKNIYACKLLLTINEIARAILTFETSLVP